MSMDRIGSIISTLDFFMNTNRKRHIVGGLLISVSLLFGGLAITVMTIGEDDRDE